MMTDDHGRETEPSGVLSALWGVSSRLVMVRRARCHEKLPGRCQGR